jgi:uncharacterized protein YecE (DUF72 family)
MKSHPMKRQKQRQIHVGTSGFQYDEWKGTFYPQTLSKAKMLPYYAERFDTTEINYSFRRIPSEKTLTNWSAATPAHFLFSLKALERITHHAMLRDCADLVNQFHRAVSHLGPKLGIVLFQLPPRLRVDAPLLSAFLEELPKGMRAAFEFRHASWFTDDVFTILRTHNIALCIADTDDLETPVQWTADYAYFRLRRVKYTKKDIAHWAEQILSLAPEDSHTFVYFKHEEAGVGPKFAQSLIKLTGGQPPPVNDELPLL